MHKINELRNKYLHPYLERDSFEDASAINYLCRAIDYYVALKDKH
jgi:hypothetical protein